MVSKWVFFWTSNNWISIFSMLPISDFHQTQAQSLICLVHSSLTLWFQVVGAWTIWQTTKASKDTNSLQASFVDVGVDTGAYVDFDLVVHKFLINIQLQTLKSMETWALFLWQSWQKSLTNKFNFFSQVLSGVDEVLSNLDQPTLCFSLIRFYDLKHLLMVYSMSVVWKCIMH